MIFWKGSAASLALFLCSFESIEYTMQSLPLRFDLFALIILLGVAQGVFLGVSFLAGVRGQGVANRCLGLLMLALAGVLGEIWLEYTNYMFQTLIIIDFAEPFDFALGPLFFFFVFGRIHHRLPRQWGWHLIPFGIWLVNSITWLYQPITFKYNSYVSAWHPELSFIPTVHYITDDDFTGLRPYISELTLFSCLIYSAWSIWIIARIYKERNVSFWGGSNNNSLSLLRSLSLLNAVFPFLIAVIKLQFYEDLGDHIIASYVTLTIYATSFMVLRGSSFFRHQPTVPIPSSIPPVVEPKKKYEKSALSPEVEDAILTKLKHLTITEKPYLDSNLSLPKLADRLGTSSHYVSQVLNDRLGQTFFDWLAAHRIAEAQQLLNDPATTHLKIEEIAERVGYNAPSAFHTAFKRIAGQTPASFRSARTS